LEDDPLGYSRAVTQRKYFVEPHIPGFAQFERWCGKRVLEVGCGIGTDTLSFARHGAQVTAVDLSPASLDVARRRAAAEGLSTCIEFVEGNVERLSDVVPVTTYDLVYSFGCLHHTPQPRRAMTELWRYMGRTSTLKVMLYHRRSWKVACLLARHWRPGRGVDEAVSYQSEARARCPVTHTYTKGMARDLLRWFDIREMRVEHIFPYRVADYVRYRYRRAWPWCVVPHPLFRWLEQRIGWHLLIAAGVMW
jgi:ubiquinone/menaquinone biosynthesis C-methylase UbiE